MSTQAAKSEIARTIRKWKKKRGALIMMLHEIQGQRGYVPRDVSRELADGIDVPLARIYEVLTFYNYFKLTSPGRAVISVCTGTACYLKGAPDVIEAVKEELGVQEGETTADGDFHLQSVRCIGCCGLAPAMVINGKTYGKVQPAHVKSIVAEWREQLAAEKPEDVVYATT
jgi:NADH-quinone oxidoreductase subunit E